MDREAYRTFRRLWMGESVSYLGAQISTLAIPLTAILLLDANVEQVALLVASGWAPYLGFPLIVGPFLEHRPRRPIAAWTNWGRAAILALIPTLYLVRCLSIEVLCFVALAVGALTVVFDTAFWSLLPAFIPIADRTRVNSRLMASASAATTAGPAVAASLVATIGAPLAIAANSVTYGFSGWNIWRTEIPETRVPGIATAGRWRRDLLLGLSVVYRNRILRPIAIYAGALNFFYQVVMTLLIVYLVSFIHVPVLYIGGILAAAGLGAFVGSIFAESFERSIGFGSAFLACGLVAGGSFAIIPFARGPPGLVTLILGTAMLLFGLGTGAASVYAITARQSLIPERHLAKGMASYRFVSYGVLPIAALAAGAISSSVGVVPTLAIGAFGLLGSSLILTSRPLLRLRSVETAAPNGDHVVPSDSNVPGGPS